jgi:hypothetical protein
VEARHRRARLATRASTAAVPSGSAQELVNALGYTACDVEHVRPTRHVQLREPERAALGVPHANAATDRMGFRPIASPVSFFNTVDDGIGTINVP